jgi:hypothetical protein
MFSINKVAWGLPSSSVPGLTPPMSDVISGAGHAILL